MTCILSILQSAFCIVKRRPHVVVRATMWRRSSRVFASAARSTADPTRRRLAYRQWRDFGASKAVVNADGGRGLPKERDNPESQTVQGAEAMKITRVGMYINLGMATTKVRSSRTAGWLVRR